MGKGGGTLCRSDWNPVSNPWSMIPFSDLLCSMFLNYNLKCALCDRKVEDLQFRVEEACITKGDLEVNTHTLLHKLKNMNTVFLSNAMEHLWSQVKIAPNWLELIHLMLRCIRNPPTLHLIRTAVETPCLVKQTFWVKSILFWWVQTRVHLWN